MTPTANPYAKELQYFKAALEAGLGLWLFRKARTGAPLPPAYVWWGAIGAFGAAAFAFYKAQKLERPEARVLPVDEIEAWLPVEQMSV